MKKVLFAIVAAILLLALTMPVAAGGGKVRGENGQGGVNQVQVMDPPPFN